MPVVLTDALIKGLKVQRGRLELADAVERGLRVRVSPRAATWWCWYRTRAGKAARFKLGTYPRLGLKKARKAARDRLAEVQLGGDPQADVKASRLKAELDERTTVRALTLACVAELPLRPSTRKEWTRLAKAEILPALGRRQAADVGRADIRLWSESIRDGRRRWKAKQRASGYSANRAFELLRRVYSWAVGRDLLPATPFVGLPLPAEETQSERVLSRDELRALLLALDACPRKWKAYKATWRTYADAVRLLLLTLVRRSAVLGMRRSELEALDGAEARWTIPGGAEGRSKSGRPHVVPLSGPALAAVRRRLDATSTEHLFPVGRTKAGEDRPATWPSGFVRELRTETERQLRKALKDEGATVPRWRVHDLRHSGATHLREDLGVASETVSMLLGHTPPGPRVSRVYNRAELLLERRAALVAWAAWLEALTAPKPARVLPHRRRGRG